MKHILTDLFYFHHKFIVS